MIKSFGSKDTKALFNGQRVSRFQSFERAAVRKLEILDRAIALAELRAVPATVWSYFEETERAITASGSTTNGGSVLHGLRVMRARSRSSIIIRGVHEHGTAQARNTAGSSRRNPE